MARIAGVDLPRHKQVVYALPYLYGVGHALARQICSKTGIAPNKMTEELTENEIRKIREVLESEIKVEGDLRPCLAGVRWLTRHDHTDLFHQTGE